MISLEYGVPTCRIPVVMPNFINFCHFDIMDPTELQNKGIFHLESHLICLFMYFYQLMSDIVIVGKFELTIRPHILLKLIKHIFFQDRSRINQSLH